MADETDRSQKTEQPTQKKLDDARKKGDVAKSQEVSALVVLVAGAICVTGLGGASASRLASGLSGFFDHAGDIAVDASTSLGLARAAGLTALAAMAVPALIVMAAAAAGHIGQTGFIVTGEKMKPKLDKISPMAGLKRLFGGQALANFLKGVGKLTIVSAAGAIALWPRADQLVVLPSLDAAALLPFAREVAISLLVAALAAYAVLAGLDYVGQRAAFERRMKMSRQEIRDEHKQTEGDPQVRARLRQVRQERARRRMMAAVPTATVVVANPTHYAVALKYVQGETAAPVCVAKGADAVALKIREVAEAHKVPIVEDPPLARALFTAVEIDRPIPREQYEAVAKIIGYVLTLARRRGRR